MQKPENHNFFNFFMLISHKKEKQNQNIENVEFDVEINLLANINILIKNSFFEKIFENTVLLLS